MHHGGREVLRLAAGIAGTDASAVSAVIAAIEAWAVAAGSGDGSATASLTRGDATIRMSRRILADRTVAEVAVVHHRTGADLTLRLRRDMSAGGGDPIIAPPAFLTELARGGALVADGRRLDLRPWIVASEPDARALIALMEAPARRLPVIVASGDERSDRPDKPLIDAEALAAAALGLAHVVVLPAPATLWLTAAFGKMRSVFHGAVRLYHAGFDAAADPYLHPLVLGTMVARDPAAVVADLWRRVRGEAIRRLPLDVAVPRFDTIARAAAGRTIEPPRPPGATLAERSSPDQPEDAGAAGPSQVGQTVPLPGQGSSLLVELQGERDLALSLGAEAETRARLAEARIAALEARIAALASRLREAGIDPDAPPAWPSRWSEVADWCDENLSGRLVLTPKARRMLDEAQFEDVALAARCLAWLAGPALAARLAGGRPLGNAPIGDGAQNSRCGSDVFDFGFGGRRLVADWHVKKSNSRDPRRCLRIYYAFDAETRQIVVAELPGHRRTDAS